MDMKNKILLFLTIALLAFPRSGIGQIAPDLKSTVDFGVLAGTAISFNGTTTVVNDMNVGLHPGLLSAITGSYSVINGQVYAADYDPLTLMVQAKQDLVDAYLEAESATPTFPEVSGDLGGQTLAPGVYKSASTLSIQSGNLTLDAGGDINAVWIFQVASAFTTIGGGPFPSPTGGNVILTNGAKAKNVYWQVGSSATIGDYTDFAGNILALTSITLNTGAQVAGRLLARNGAVTFAGGGLLNNPNLCDEVIVQITGDTEFCQGSSSVLTVTAGEAYLWSTNETTQSITVSQSGIYSVVLTDINGCDGTDSVQVSVNPLPVVTINGITEFCEGGSTILTASQAVSYLWSTGEITQSIEVSLAGIYSVEVTDINGCNGSNQVEVIVYPSPMVTITGDTNFCEGESTILTASQAVSYLWSTGEITQSIEVSLAGIYSVEVTDINGCTGSNQVEVIVYPSPMVTITGDTDFCEGESTILTASQAVSYLWSTGEITQSIEVSQAGIYSVEVTDINGCIGSNQVEVIVYPSPLVSITGDNDFCQGESTILTASQAVSYLWSTGEITQSINVSLAGIYSVEVTDINGCTGSNQVEVIVYPSPIVNINGITELCNGGSTILTASQAVSYLWSTGEITQSINVSLAGIYSVEVTDINGCEGTDQVNVVMLQQRIINISGNTGFCEGGSTILTATVGQSYLWNTNEITQSIVVSQAGIYSVQVIDENGCEGSAQILITEYPLPLVSINGDTDFCEGESSILTASPAESYLWSTNENTQSIMVTQSGNYSVVVTDLNGCQNMAEIKVEVFPSPLVSITGDDFCEGESSVLTASPAESYLWSTNENTQSITVSQSGNYSIVVTDLNGCQSMAEIMVEVFPSPIVSIDGKTEICEGEATILTATEGDSYLWSTGEITQRIVVTQAGDYSVIVTDINGCEGTDTITLMVNMAPVIITEPINQTGCTGDQVSFTVLATGSGLTYQWMKGNLNLVDGGNISGANTATLTINPIDICDATTGYHVVVSGECLPNDTSVNVSFSVNVAPEIILEPIDQLICSGCKVNFWVGAIGTGLTYQWRKGNVKLVNGDNISGVNTPVLTIDPVDESDVAPNYNVIVSGICAPNDTSVYVSLDTKSAPMIISEPVDQIICAGDPAIFEVVASGSGLTYQWRKGNVNIVNGGNISGANTATLTIDPGNVSDIADDYNVVIDGTSCSPNEITSVRVSLEVSVAPEITKQPVSQVVWTGDSVSFSVVATGTDLTYQWRNGNINLTDGGNISGSNTSKLTIKPVHLSDASSNYNVVVSGICEPDVVSRAVTLWVCGYETADFDPVLNNNVTTSVVSFDGTKSNTAIAVYPNPFSNSIDIEINETLEIENLEFRMYNALGDEVIFSNITEQLTTLTTSQLVSGIYFYKVIVNKKIIQSGKLISKQ